LQQRFFRDLVKGWQFEEMPGDRQTEDAADHQRGPDLGRHALAATTIDQLLFSTDYPFQHPTRDELQQFLTEFDTDQDRNKFSSENARRLFGIS
jgi:predicted TIM-barrel fold metal-dependent hydrolase